MWIDAPDDERWVTALWRKKKRHKNYALHSKFWTFFYSTVKKRQEKTVDDTFFCFVTFCSSICVRIYSILKQLSVLSFWIVFSPDIAFTLNCAHIISFYFCFFFFVGLHSTQPQHPMHSGQSFCYQFARTMNAIILDIEHREMKINKQFMPKCPLPPLSCMQPWSRIHYYCMVSKGRERKKN